MAGRGMAGAAPAPVKTEYRKTGTDRVAKWTCDKYDVYGDGQKASEVCTVSVAALGLSAADVDVMRQLGQFQADCVTGNRNVRPRATQRSCASSACRSGRSKPSPANK